MADKQRRSEKALSAVFVRQVSAPGRYFDGQGLFLRVAENGARYWVQRITIRGKRCEIGIGNPSLVSLSEARELAIENRKAARAGDDPLASKRRAEAILTFEQATRKVHELHRPTWKNEKHAAQFLSTLEAYAFPRLGPIKAAEVTSADVLAALSSIWTDKPETARRVRQRIGMVMKWCIAQGWRKDNPAVDIERALPKTSKAQRHRRALPYAEVSNCLSVVRGSGASAATKLALEFLVLTAVRSGEVREATWGEFDFHGAPCATQATRATWIIPAARMKMKRAHRVPLSQKALALLVEAEALRATNEPDALVFPGSKAMRPLSDMTLSKLVKELGFDADVHGFRTSFRMWAQEQTNYPREVCEAALAHVVKDKAEAAYARSDLFEKRADLMQDWAKFLEKAPHSDADVVPIGAL